MASPLFNTFGNSPQPGNNLFSNMSNFLTRFNQFRQNFNGDPQQMVQQMLNSGKMTQEQFNQASNLANQLMRFVGGSK